MNDKYLHGLLAGLAGGVAAIAVNLLVILILKAHILRYIDFAGILSFGRMPRGFWETCFALIVYTGFAGTLGVIFSYMLPYLGTACLSLKGMHYGSCVWFSSYAITTLYKTPHLVTISLESATSNFCAAIVYGLVMALVLGWFLARGQDSSPTLK